MVGVWTACSRPDGPNGYRIRVPTILRATRASRPGPSRRPVVVRTAVAAAAVALLLSGCDIGETTRGLADEFGNARQVEADDLATAGTLAGGAASGAPSSTPSALPSYASGSSVGEYAPGFPSGLLRTPQGARLLATSAEPVEGSKPRTVQITLNMSSENPPGRLMDQVAWLLGDQGFDALEAPAESGMDEQAAFTRTTTVQGAEVDESLLVGVLKDGRKSLLTLSGTVAATPKG